MLKASFSLDNWTAMIDCSRQTFRNKSSVACDKPTRERSQKAETIFGLLFWLQSLCEWYSLTEIGGFYSNARDCIKRYADLSWVKLEDEESLAEIEYYKSIAVANAFVIDLLEGNKEVLPEYVSFLKACDREELTAGLLNILDSALKFSYSVDWALEELHGGVEKANDNSHAVDVRYYVEYIHLLSIYLFKRGKTEYAIT